MPSQKLKTMVTALHVLPQGDPMYSEMGFEIRIADDAAGGFIELVQDKGAPKPGVVSIDPDEWPALRSALNRMFRACEAYNKSLKASG